MELKNGQYIVYMKVGFHIQEKLEEIIVRKKREIDDTGYTLWGYGGTVCNPKKQVQPVADEAAKNDQPFYLCMVETKSGRPVDNPKENNFYSVDKKNYCRMPATIRVPESKRALVIKSLERKEFCLPLNKTVVAVGKKEGTPGNEFIRKRVDKACLRLTDDIDTSPRSDCPNSEEQIVLVAELHPPYAVFLKSLQGFELA